MINKISERSMNDVSQPFIYNLRLYNFIIKREITLNISRKAQLKVDNSFDLIFSISIKICNNTHFPFPLMQKSIGQLDPSLEGPCTKLLVILPNLLHVVRCNDSMRGLERKVFFTRNQTCYD